MKLIIYYKYVTRYLLTLVLWFKYCTSLMLIICFQGFDLILEKTIPFTPNDSSKCSDNNF